VVPDTWPLPTYAFLGDRVVTTTKDGTLVYADSRARVAGYPRMPLQTKTYAQPSGEPHGIWPKTGWSWLTSSPCRAVAMLPPFEGGCLVDHLRPGGRVCLAAQGDRPLRVLDAGGRVTARLARARPGLRLLALAPGGGLLTYADDGCLRFVARTGGGERVLASHVGSPVGALFSPDRKSIALMLLRHDPEDPTGRKDRGEVVLLPVKGGSPTRLTELPKGAKATLLGWRHA
jgi:hypothetical protein